MERIKSMKESLMACAQGQMGNLHNVDAKELGAVIDMIKDLEEALYYCSITKAMEEKEKNGGQSHNYYENKYYPIMYYTDKQWDEIRKHDGYVYDPYLGETMRDKRMGRMYYDGSTSYQVANGGTTSNSGQSRNYPVEIRDAREGRSGVRRRFYMEAKEENHGTPEKIKELEEYLKELSEDITEMIEGAAPEEKTMLQQKLVNLANKVKNV